MGIHNLGNAKLSLRVALPTLMLAIVSIALLEWRGLYNIEHPKPEKINCISCHSDKRTLEAMADKAGDKLYLVHSGQLTLAQLNKLTGKQNDPTAPPLK